MSSAIAFSLTGSRVGSKSFTGRAVESCKAMSARPVARGAISTTSRLKLVPKPQTTAQKMKCGEFKPGFGYELWEPSEVAFPKDNIVFGRDNRPGSKNDVIINVAGCADVHARITLQEDGKSFLVEDLGSGTYINGVEYKSGSGTAKAGDEISFDLERGVTFKVASDMSFMKKASSLFSGPPPAYSSEAALDERVTERQAWIAKWKTRTGKGVAAGATAAPPAPAPAGVYAASSSEASFDARIEDRKAWINGWKARTGKSGGAAAASSSEASFDARIEDRKAWINGWKARTGKSGGAAAASSSEASFDARIEDRKEWIGNWKARTGAGAASAPAAARGGSPKLRVAINGFGRIGRNFLRCWQGRADSNLEVVVINDSGGVRQASHLLKYDSMLGTFKADVRVVSDSAISVDGKRIDIVSSRDPLKLPWKDMNIDLVIEGTGVFIDEAGAGKHLQAGAKKVLITAPAKGDGIPTYVMSVNDGDFDPKAPIISNASCTTNCLAPFVKVIDDEFKVIKGTMTTTHSYTGDQRLLDASHRDLRRARAAALNIVPTSTGAAKAVALVLPQLKGKLNGIALRVPTPNVSIVDLVVQVEKKTSAAEVNLAFTKAANGYAKGVLGITEEPLVSVDFRCSDVSTTIDAALTMVMGDDYVKVVAWYDNEWGYSQRVVDLAELCAAKWID